MNISVIGLGKLGLPFSFFLSSKKNKVLGFDIDKKIQSKINKNIRNIEPKLNSYINKYKKNFRFEKKVDKLIEESNITFLVLPTPSLKNGSFSNKYIIDILKKIYPSLLKKKGLNHLIVITSTVSPGSCDEVFIPFLKKKGLKNKIDFSLVYNPHFIAQGTTIKNLEKPDLLLIGVDNQKTYQIIKRFYKKFYNEKIFKRTTFREGEISKIAINSYITSKISFANYISELCERTKDTDAKNVLNVVGEDKRINHSYLKIGTKFSGPCFPRDNLALSHYSKTKNVNSLLPDRNDEINKIQSKRLVKILKKLTRNISTYSVGICGMTYKNDTNIYKDSQGEDLIKLMIKEKMNYDKINVYDNFLDKSYKIDSLKNRIRFFKNQKKFIDNSDIIFVMYNIKNLNFFKTNTKKKKIIVDCWRCIENLPKNFEKIELGKFF